MHPYPARFIPQIPRKAIQDYTKPGDTVLDPFCGCGTTLLEASLLNRVSIGVDNNPVANLVSKAKITNYSNSDVKELVQHLKEIPSKVPNNANKSYDIPNYKERDYWFSHKALLDLGFIKYKANSLSKKPKCLAMATLSSIVVRTSFQDSDTRYAKVSKHYISGSALKWYTRKLKKAIQSIRYILNLKRSKSNVYLADSRNLSFIKKNSIDLIVTSPPYLNAYDYHKYHRHRMHWIDGDVSFARDLEIGKHDTFTKKNSVADPYFEDMKNCFIEWRRVIKKDGRVIILIGDAIVSGKPITVGDNFVKIMSDLGFKLTKRWVRTIKASRKSFNREARIKEEHVLLFKK